MKTIDKMRELEARKIELISQLETYKSDNEHSLGDFGDWSEDAEVIIMEAGISALDKTINRLNRLYRTEQGEDITKDLASELLGVKTYCTQNNEDCNTCSLSNYGKDCKNN